MLSRRILGHNMRKKSQSTNDMEDGMLEVRLFISGIQNFIQVQSIFIHLLSIIFGYLDRK